MEELSAVVRKMPLVNVMPNQHKRESLEKDVRRCQKAKIIGLDLLNFFIRRHFSQDSPFIPPAEIRTFNLMQIVTPDLQVLPQPGQQIVLDSPRYEINSWINMIQQSIMISMGSRESYNMQGCLADAAAVFFDRIQERYQEEDDLSFLSSTVNNQVFIEGRLSMILIYSDDSDLDECGAKPRKELRQENEKGD